MAKLTVRLIGPFQVILDGKQISDFRSDKVRGLLAYILIESQRPWSRSFLADLLWPDLPEAKAQSNLSNALWNLRATLGDNVGGSSFILVKKSTIQFNQSAGFWLDVFAFNQLVEKICTKPQSSPAPLTPVECQEYLSKFEGEFMEGFSIDSPTFETWLVNIRQEIHEKRVKALQCLTTLFLQSNQSILALDCAQQWIKEEPWDENAYRQAMEILIEQSQRKKALDLFTLCQNRLAEDLGIEPEQETLDLYQQIIQGVEHQSTRAETEQNQGSPQKQIDPGSPPEHLTRRILEKLEQRPFFDRKDELGQLDHWLKNMVAGHGSVDFITGEPGSGKTYLLTEFASQSLQKYPNLILLWGQCNAYTGQGDPYFPFMTMAKMLVGDFESLIAGPIINLEHLNRLWQNLPELLSILMTQGPDLIKRLIVDTHQISLAKVNPGVSTADYGALAKLVNETPHRRSPRVGLNDQFVRVLKKISDKNQLLLILDDMQWIDEGSANLLFHLGRQLEHKNILLIGCFRPAEVKTAYDESSHHLYGILQEMKMIYGENKINLDQSQGEAFIKELLASEPNAFSGSFHQKLYKHTSGHPLFSIELLRGMQLRNEIQRDKEGKWVTSEHLDWKKIPARVESVIARRFSMLPPDCRSLMESASILGDVFSVEILSAVLNKPEKQIFDLLNEVVCKRHRLISPQGVQQVGNETITFYRFTHILFQTYLYNQLNQIEKIRLHGLVGEALEKTYADHFPEFPQMTHTLARHFELAHLPGKAVKYYKLAGDNATRLMAHHEAIQHYDHALALLRGLPQTPQRNRIELDIQLSLGPPITALKGWGAPELETAYDRAQILCERVDDPSKLVPALWLLATFRLGRAEHAEVDRLVKRLFHLTRQINDPALLAMAYLQVSPFYQGKFKEARQLLERASALKNINFQRHLALRYGMAPAIVALSYLSNCLLIMGYPEQSIMINQQALELIEQINHPMTACYVIGRSCWMALIRNETKHLGTQSEQLFQTAHKHGFRNFEIGAVFFKNWLSVIENHEPLQAINAMQNNTESYNLTKTILNLTAFLLFFAKACLQKGLTSQGINAINESIALGEKTAERWLQAEAWRIKGHLHLPSHEHQPRDNVNDAEAFRCFKTSYEIAKAQGAKLWELRAAMSIAEVYDSKGKGEVGRELLEESYRWFTEGFQTKDLQKAKKLLKKLGEFN